MTALSLSFSVYDYLVFFGMLAVSFGIGIYHAFKSSGSNEEYLNGGHSIGILPMAISLCASFNSAYTILGIPSEMYTFGTQFYIMILGTGVGVMLGGELWVPLLYKLKVVSIYEYFEMRYKSKLPRLLMTVIFVMKTTLYVALVLYAPTIALSSVTNISWWACILLLGVCSTIYTTLGGMKAIVWTDVFQIFIMFGGVLAILIKGLNLTGGFGEVWRIAEESGRIEFFNWSADLTTRHTFLNVFVGTIILWGSPYICSQYLVHRCLCLESVTKGKMALYLNYVGQVTMVTAVAFIGLILYAFYRGCDPVLAGVVDKRDAVIPLFVMQQFSAYPGIPGIFVSCLFSGALSTLDSALHSLAAVTWEEIKHFKRFKDISLAKETKITKALSVMFGLIATGMAFLCSNLGSLINAGGILFGACMGPMFAFSLISILCPIVNLKGVTVGLLTGQLINLWLSIGSAVYRPPAPMLELTIDNCTGIFEDIPVVAPSSSVLSEEAEDDSLASFDLMSIYNMSYNIYPIIGFFFTFVVGILASLCFGGGKDLNVQDEDYFVPWAWRLYNRFYPVHRCKAKVDSQSAGNEEVLLTEMNGIL